MKVKINQDKTMSEIEIIVNCPAVDARVRNLLDALRQCAVSLTGMAEDMTVCVPLHTILYIESINRKTFFYDESRVFRCRDSLTALEALLEQYRFIRISKSCIVNIAQVAPPTAVTITGWASCSATGNGWWQVGSTRRRCGRASGSLGCPCLGRGRCWSTRGKSATHDGLVGWFRQRNCWSIFFWR